ncbi:MAG: hypothetical protein JST12_00045 [Armatimonadetes bacterium]|nr:hypothetical protein [Armatimonadota bacterium]
MHFRHGDWGDDGRAMDFGRVPQEYNVPDWNNEAVRVGTATELGSPEDRLTYGYGLADVAQIHMPTVETFSEIGVPEGLDWYEVYGDDVNDPLGQHRLKVHAARNLEVRGKYQEAVKAYRMLNPALSLQSFANDRQELLEEGVNAKTKGYSQYLRDRYLIEFGIDEQQKAAIDDLKKMKADSRVQAHIDYALADAGPTETAYLKVANDHPHSHRAEAALIMAARHNLEDSTEKPKWDPGTKLLRWLTTKYPKSRFRAAAEGWLGGYALTKNDILTAVTHYIFQAHSPQAYEAAKGEYELSQIALVGGRTTNAIAHLLLSRHFQHDMYTRVTVSRRADNLINGLKADEAKRLNRQVACDPLLLQAYLEYRLSDTKMDPKDERRLLTFITDSVDRLNRFDKTFYAQLAELTYRVGRYQASIRFARRAKGGESDAKARFIEGGSLDRLGRHQEAIRAFETLVKMPNVPAYLGSTAEEELAFLHEKHGDPLRAYALYRELGYANDIAFLVDSELSCSQVARLIPRATSHKERSILKYSLAMRYFRQERYEDAKRALLSLPKELRLYRGLPGATYRDVYGQRWDDDQKTPLEVIDPMVDVTTMEKFRKQAERARTRESRAKALYGLVQYSHKRRNLMYYSPGLWKGGRSSAYPVFWSPAINKGRFQQIAIKSAFDQECDAQTLKFCKELIRRCPHSSYMPKALYTAGICAESLSRFNGFWQDNESRLCKVGARYMRQVVREYPHDPLAKPAAKYADVFADEETPNY